MVRKNSNSKQLEDSVSKEVKPNNAKLVLFTFGVGPIIILFAYLTLTGFFD